MVCLTSLEKDKICDACQFTKQVKTSFKLKDYISTDWALQSLQLDLFGPLRTQILGRKYYAFIIVDDLSRITWVLFLAINDELFLEFTKFSKKVQNKKGHTIVNVRSDHGDEFSNEKFW